MDKKAEPEKQSPKNTPELQERLEKAIAKDKKVRTSDQDALVDEQIDESFPASDAPARY
jgi:hypothetical protein